MYKTIVIRTEPREDIYQQLLLFACNKCKTFSLDWIESSSLNVQRKPIADELNPFLTQETSTPWGQHIRSRRFYQLTPKSSRIIGKAKSLYIGYDKVGWPQNLAFYVNDDNPWLVSFTHNREAYIYTQAIPFENIRDEISFLDLETEKPVLEIDGINFSTLTEFYDEILDKLIPNTKWGKDLEGFNDILWGYSFVLIWVNSHLSRERLGYPETIKQLEKRKLRCYPSFIPSLEQDIEKAKKNEGATVFDWLVEIIEGHETIDLVLE